MLFKKRKRIIFATLFLLGLAVSTFWFTATNHSLKNITKSETFTVVYSNAMDDGAEIVKYSNKGEILDKKNLVNAQSLYYFAKVKNDYYLMSERKNRHYILNQNGILQPFFGSNKYGKDRNIGTSFLKESDNHVFFSMNVGINPSYSPTQYTNELVYFDKKNLKYRNILLDGYLLSTVEYNNMAYTLYVNNNDNSVGIYVIDLKTSKKTKQFTIENRLHGLKEYFPVGQNGASLQIFKGKLIVFLDGNTSDTQFHPIMQIIDPKNGKLESETSLSDTSFLFYDSQIYNDKLYILSEDLNYTIFNDLNKNPKKLRLKQSNSVSEKIQNEKGVISGVQYLAGSVFVLYDYVKNSPADRIREIREYDLLTGKELHVIPLAFKSNKEMIRFFLTN
ncbi:hypothetical protein [Paenibacillus maysiensis]|uniref:hypothetical protein n=1 Tax=Paenibacillus maysiensis TaxID=1155954 RepID=UPI0004B534EA|nr:hypothetical protein [Paenibacillus maysiensis]